VWSGRWIDIKVNALKKHTVKEMNDQRRERGEESEIEGGTKWCHMVIDPTDVKCHCGYIDIVLGI